MAYNFITKHIINSIEDQIKQKRQRLKNPDFLYLDDPIKVIINKEVIINRVNSYAYSEGKNLPISWYILSPKDLLKIYSIIKENKFHVIKEKDGTKYKIRLRDKSFNVEE